MGHIIFTYYIGYLYIYLLYLAQEILSTRSRSRERLEYPMESDCEVLVRLRLLNNRVMSFGIGGGAVHGIFFSRTTKKQE